MTNTTLSDEVLIRKKLQENPGVVLESVAAQHQLSLAEVIEFLPQEMWQKASGSRFVGIMQALPALGNVTLVMNTPDVILEFSGTIPNGSYRNGFYNLAYTSPLHGHLRADRCGAIYLLERPFMQKQTVSLQFMNIFGAAMFKIFAGRDEQGNLIPEQIARMRSWFRDSETGEGV